MAPNGACTRQSAKPPRPRTKRKSDRELEVTQLAFTAVLYGEMRMTAVLHVRRVRSVALRGDASVRERGWMTP